MTKIVTVPTKPERRKRDRTQPVNWYAPEDRMITEEMIVKAWRAYNEPKGSMRAALEAVEPALIAQGMREAAGMLVDNTGDYVCPFEARAILARAQELDPK